MSPSPFLRINCEGFRCKLNQLLHIYLSISCINIHYRLNHLYIFVYKMLENLPLWDEPDFYIALCSCFTHGTSERTSEKKG